MATAMILAAGFGTRLRPLTDELPKPLVWVGDRPAIAHIAERLAVAGIADIVVNSHHRAEAFSREILARVPGRLHVVSEPEIFGTAGGVANAAPLLGPGDVVVWNGDILAPLDVAALRAAHVSGRAGATLAITRKRKGEGTVGLGARGQVVRLRGELFGDEVEGGDFLGIYVLGEEFRKTLPVPGCLMAEGLLPWLRGGAEVATFAAALEWDDIGSIEAYLKANRRWLESRGEASYRGKGAMIASAVELAASVVGEGATVRGEGRFEGVVVWPGATATAPLRNAVVTTEGRVALLTPGKTSPP